MYRTLGEIIQASSADAYIYSDLNNVYKYTNSDIAPEGDYIYLPMTTFEEESFAKIEKHLQNPNCKGFFIKKDLTSNIEYLNILHKYFPKNVLVVRNVYNAGFDIAKLIANSMNSEIILLAGTDENEEIKEKLSYALNIKNLPYITYWEKIIDPVLRMDENDKFVIIETNLHKPKTAGYTAAIKKGMTVVYSKISMTNIKTYGGVEKYLNEWSYLSSNMPKNIFIKDNNDLLNLSYSNNLHIIDDYVKAVLESFNINADIQYPAKEQEKVTINQTGSLYSIKNSIRKFIKENENKTKVIIMSRIPNLDTLTDSIHSEIIKEITEDIDYLCLVSMSSYVPDLRINNKSTQIKKLNDTKDDSLMELKQYLRINIANEDARYLIISGDQRLWNLV